MLDSHNSDLFDEARALRCFGSVTMVAQLLTLFLTQVEVKLKALRHAQSDGNGGEIESGMHWLRGGLSYMFSPAAERICRRLDHEVAQSPRPDLSQTISDLETVIWRLQQHVSEMARVQAI